MSYIECTTMAQFITVCAGLVREGVIYNAYAATLTIELTGGY